MSLALLMPVFLLIHVSLSIDRGGDVCNCHLQFPVAVDMCVAVLLSSPLALCFLVSA